MCSDTTTAFSAGTRTETDSLGSIDIPADRYWGPQTERARRLFRIGIERFPPGMIRAVGLHKWACAEANQRLGELPAELAGAIRDAAEEIIEGRRDADFPLPIWQTGSGTQTNMNANEVISNRANEMLGQTLGTRKPVHPNDHVNRGQSSNDNFPTMMHIAAVEAVEGRLLPALGRLHAALWRRSEEWAEIIKLGRTHMMDAVPMTLGQETAAWARQVELGQERLRGVLPRLLSLPQGGTAVGTGLNRHRDFDAVFCTILTERTGLAFSPNPNKFEGMGAHDAFVELQGAMNTIAVSLNKVANDIRLLGSGPRSGLGELVVPADGLSSSIMPGKTNPTQSEALTMVCAQVMGNTTTVTVAGAQGHLELNVFKPVIIQAVLQSATLLADAAESFAEHMVLKLEPNRERIAENLARSLMLVTALNPRIGYDKAVAIGKKALAENLTLKEAAQRLGHVAPEDFDRWVRPEDMVTPGATLDGGG
ncbi:fumarate hydratase class II 1 [Siccirubricoccus deserti]|uniref:Fumarate hydratase class II n=1 Tax=Siccirubricoccus deserti TaxID=2013562 RepID=A0A9X0UCY8_9PROT|nr:class II fumarate hydratase [Siccirubricoccus deserti]MBC4014968.1 class II fumarate hydratase [Siccirubricoccus deserti]GGC36630.1 fumarate hydratase class II 1 [Siccirubricoccus deserti]